MSKQNSKHILFGKRGVALLLTILLLAGFTACKNSEPEYITGNEWLVKQKASLTDLDAYTSNMDEVISLYAIGSMSETDFSAELDLLKQQYDILVALREKLKQENPIKEGSHSYLSKRGTDALDRYYDTLGEVLNNLTTADGNPLAPEEMTYRYMAYQQTLNTCLAEYTTAMVWLEESTNE